MQTLVQASSLRPRVEIASHTDAGRDPDKAVNEDAMAYRATPFGHLLVVCDGMGGHHSGEEASNTALRTIIELLETAPLDTPVRAAIDHAVRMANDRVHALGSPETAARPGSTIVLAVVQAGGAIVAHVGDSRAYLVRRGNAIALTRDHSVVQQMVDQGLITAEQAIGHPDANRILRALGVAPAVDVEVRSDTVGFAAGDTFVLCTDGLTDLVMGPEIARVVSEAPSPDDACKRLVDLANERGGHDNISVLIARVLDDAAGQAAPTIVNTRPDTVPDNRPFVPTPTETGHQAHMMHHQTPPGIPQPPHTPPQMQPMPPAPISSGALPPVSIHGRQPTSHRNPQSGGVERGLLVAGVILVLLLLAVLAAVTGVLLARPKHAAPAFVDAAVVPSPVLSTALPARDPTPIPELAPSESAPLPSMLPSPGGRPRHRPQEPRPSDNPTERLER